MNFLFSANFHSLVKTVLIVTFSFSLQVTATAGASGTDDTSAFKASKVRPKYSEKRKKRKGQIHEHGKAEVSIAIQGAKGKLELKTPMESLTGFETKPKTSKEIASYDLAMSKLSSEISKVLRFDENLLCEIKKEMVERTEERIENDEVGGRIEDHSDISVSYNFSCEKPLEGSRIVIDFSKAFPRIKTANVSLLSGMIQKSEVYKGQALTIEVK